MREHSREELERAPTFILGNLYRIAFSSCIYSQEDLSQLELITSVLSQRDFPEKTTLYRTLIKEVRVQMGRNNLDRSFEATFSLVEMLRHYGAKVLGFTDNNTR